MTTIETDVYLRPSRAIEALEVPGDAKLPRDIKLTPEQSRVSVDRYSSLEFHQKEIEKLWLRVWQIAGRVDEIPDEGDYFEYSIGHNSFVILRGDDNRIRAFHNVCKHRANALVEGSGNTGPALVCQFHLWSYNLDGSLRRVSDRDTFCPIEDSDFGLEEIAADTWGGFVFINPAGEDAPPLEEFLGVVTQKEHLGAYRLEDVAPLGLNVTLPVACNWKVGMEAFMEAYHAQGIHPQILPGLDDYNLHLESFGDHSRMLVHFGVPSPRLGDVDDIDTETVFTTLFGLPEGEAKRRIEEAGGIDTLGSMETSASGDKKDGSLADLFTTADPAHNPCLMLEQYRNESGEVVLPEGTSLRDVISKFFRESNRARGIEFPDLSDDQMVDDWHYHVFPNLVFNITVGAFFYMAFRPDWNDPNRCYWDIAVLHWFPDAEERKKVRTPKTLLPENTPINPVLDQDAYQLSRVQRGLRSGVIEDVLLSSQESLIGHFNQVVDDYLARD